MVTSVALYGVNKYVKLIVVQCSVALYGVNKTVIKLNVSCK